MALFMQRPEEQQNDWTGLPSEPRDTTDRTDTLGAVPAVDPSAIDLGGDVTSVVVPVAVPAPEADSTTDSHD
ncbi:MAG: hypothetical protein ACQEW8_11975 [Actinomycetota bacterium]